jgi:hypothetical protein
MFNLCLKMAAKRTEHVEFTFDVLRQGVLGQSVKKKNKGVALFVACFQIECGLCFTCHASHAGDLS